jgi:hypothetical protein
MAMSMRSDKLKVTLFQAFAMRAKSAVLFALSILLTCLAVAARAAETNLANQDLSAAPVVGTTLQAPPAALPTSNQPSTLDAAQQPVLDDAALTAPGLSRAFEAFQPSEAISADNAVPFPNTI